MFFELKQQFRIESARFLPELAKDHPCSRTHGHSFMIEVALRGSLNPTLGWVRDYHEIQKVTQECVLSQLDHRLLNEVPGLQNPTSEMLAVWVYERLKPALKELYQITIRETPETSCTYPVI